MTRSIQMPLLAALAMSLGWGIRGDYGHEAGALLPGALVALAIVFTSGRADWLARTPTVAMLGALGWAFGGQMSYGIVIGYTASASFPDVAYGFASLFLIGALWGGIGAGILGLGLTWESRRLESFVIPLSTLYALWLLLDLSGLSARLEDRWPFDDTDWVAATSALLIGLLLKLFGDRWRDPARLLLMLAGGWCAGYGILTLTLGLRMTPPRSDNWAGCVGLAIALTIFLWREGNRATLLLVVCGLLAGGLGFAIGDFVQMLGRAGWGPIGRYEALQHLDYWKWMERLFGLIMGAGLGLAVQRLVREGLTPLGLNKPARSLRGFSLAVLLIVMPWENFVTNLRVWIERGQLSEPLLGIGPRGWVFLIALALSGLIATAICRHLRDELPTIPVDPAGRAQLLLIAITWLFIVGDFTRVVSHLNTRGILSVHVGFWLTGILITCLAICYRAEPALPVKEVAATDYSWRPGVKLIIGWLLVPLLIVGLTKLTLSTHTDPLPGSRQRFTPDPPAPLEVGDGRLRMIK